jgi:hypothetical protein
MSVSRIIQIILALCVLLTPTLVFAQGGPPPLPPSTPSQAEQQRENQAHPVDRAQQQATLARREQRMREAGVSVPDRNQPKPPDAVPPHLQRNPNPPTQPTGPRPPEPPRRSEDPSYPLLGLLETPLDQTAIQCGAGTQSYVEAFDTQRVRAVMFCHSPLSFYTSQALDTYHTSWVYSPLRGWYEWTSWDEHAGCSRWAFDWQAWWCPMDGGYNFDTLACPVWSRTMTYVYGFSPGDNSQYYYSVPTPWVQGCGGA